MEIEREARSGLGILLNRMLKNAAQQGRSERRGEAYVSVR